MQPGEIITESHISRGIMELKDVVHRLCDLKTLGGKAENRVKGLIDKWPNKEKAAFAEVESEFMAGKWVSMPENPQHDVSE